MCSLIVVAFKMGYSVTLNKWFLFLMAASWPDWLLNKDITFDRWQGVEFYVRKYGLGFLSPDFVVVVVLLFLK